MRWMRSKKRGERGFTLIELMIVIVIIGILAAIAIPRFIGAQDRARIGAAKSELNAVRQALSMYEMDHATYPTSATSWDDLRSQLVDPNTQNPYVALPETPNFEFVSYQGDAQTYTLVVRAFDNARTQLTATPEGVTP